MSKTLPSIGERLPAPNPWCRDLPLSAPFSWLKAGWSDFCRKPAQSLAYGLLVFVLSLLIIAGILRFKQEALLLPALAAFMVMAPFLALGLYEKSRALAAGEKPSLTSMLLVRPRSGGQVLFVGLMLGLLAMLWIRAAVLIYALFFGYLPFPGMDQLAQQILGTPQGWSMMGVGMVVGGLFAAFACAISAFSLPRMLTEDADALAAMGRSFALSGQNIQLATLWGLMMSTGFLLCLVTGLLALIVVFPILGHASYHAAKAMHPEDM